jgi:hypothetical protein
MVDFAKTMAGTAVGIGSLALVGESMKMIPDFGEPVRKGKGKRRATRRKTTPMIKGAANLMVGTALLGGAAGMVNQM